MRKVSFFDMILVTWANMFFIPSDNKCDYLVVRSVIRTVRYHIILCVTNEK